MTVYVEETYVEDDGVSRVKMIADTHDEMCRVAIHTLHVNCRSTCSTAHTALLFAPQREELLKMGAVLVSQEQFRQLRSQKFGATRDRKLVLAVLPKPEEYLQREVKIPFRVQERFYALSKVMKLKKGECFEQMVDTCEKQWLHAGDNDQMPTGTATTWGGT